MIGGVIGNAVACGVMTGTGVLLIGSAYGQYCDRGASGMNLPSQMAAMTLSKESNGEYMISLAYI